MRRMLVVWAAALALLAGAAASEDAPVERVPDEVLQKALPRVVGLIEKALSDAAFKVSPLAEKAVAYKCDGGPVLLLVPDAGLSKKSIEDAAAKVSPAGWVVMRGIGPVVNGGIPPLERLARIEPDDSAPVTVLLLGVRQEGDKRVLEVYSRETKPLLSAAISHKEGAADRVLDLKLGNVDQAAGQADVILLLPGGYEATLRVGATQ